MDLVMILDYIHTKLQKDIKLNLREYSDLYTLINKNNHNKKDNDYTLAITVLSKTKGKSYACARKELIEKFNEIDENIFPTLHKLTKSRPKMDQLAFEKELDPDGDIPKNNKENGFDIDNNAAPRVINQQTIHTCVTGSSSQYDNEDATVIVQSNNDKIN